MTDAIAQLPPLIASHVLLAAAAMALALLIGLPLGFASARRPRLAAIAVGFATAAAGFAAGWLSGTAAKPAAFTPAPVRVP